MGTLLHRASRRPHLLESETLLGRTKLATIPLTAPNVSGQHALLSWSVDGCWAIQDLSSTNGTFVDGQRLPPGVRVPLAIGSRLALGSSDAEFELIDVSAPDALLIACDGTADTINLKDGIVALPSEDNVQATVFDATDGSFRLEYEGATRTLGHGEIVVVGDRSWRLSLPNLLAPTRAEREEEGWSPVSLCALSLEFAVSSDEEAVELRLRRGTLKRSLGVRAHFYLLLTLARCRVHHELVRAANVTEDGWVEIEALQDMLRVTRDVVNVHIFRTRNELRAAGVLDASQVVDRQAGRRALRLGTTRVDFSTLD